MFLVDVPVNLLTVFLAALTYFIIGSIWYAPQLFGKCCLKHHEGYLEEPAEKKFHISSYIGEFILSLILAYVLTLFIQLSQAEDYAEGIAVAAWIWLGFIATTHFSAVLWDRKTLKSFFIHAAFMLLGLIAMAAVIMYFEP